MTGEGPESRTRSSVDAGAAAKGAAVTVGMTAGPLTVVRLAVGGEAVGAERSLWVVPVLALFAAFAVGGYTAARIRPAVPYRQAAAAAGIAFAAFVVFTVARRLIAGDGLSVPLVVTMAVLGQIGVSFALLGGYVAWRRSR